MNILFINSVEKACGVHQFGEQTYNVIKESKKYDFIYVEPRDAKEFTGYIEQYSPPAILYNFYPCTMDWINHRLLNGNREHLKQFAILHELAVTGFDYLISPDPTFVEHDNVFRVGRPLQKFSGTYPKNSITTIGSFGFGMGWKGFPELVTLVNKEFDEAVINLQIPYAYWGDANGESARKTALESRGRMTKPGIKLNIDHTFLSTDDLLQFLANNDLNAFVYPQGAAKGGISSCMDSALSVRRPVAITRVPMFRHIYNTKPNICVYDAMSTIIGDTTTLREIIKNGTKPLEEFYEKFSNENLTKDYERVFEEVL